MGALIEGVALGTTKLVASATRRWRFSLLPFE
jgi:hypothetical protein